MIDEILVGDVREKLREMPAGSAQTCVTSPPYWGLRDYGTAEWEGGDDASCDHRNWKHPPDEETPGGRGGSMPKQETVNRERCSKCGASRVDAQIGLEPTIDEYIANMVDVFREVRRVLRDDGTLWLNMGSAYSTGASAPRVPGAFALADEAAERQSDAQSSLADARASEHTADSTDDMLALLRTLVDRIEDRGPSALARAYCAIASRGFKQKDLIDQPQMLATALRLDGWYLRSDIIWSKKNPMPEPATDRPTKSHEHIFLLTKQPQYYYDAEAIREDGAGRLDRGPGPQGRIGRSPETWASPPLDETAGRNKRDVWTVATQPYPDAHFATFPEDLIRPCILAGSPARCCAECGAPWVRQVERGDVLSTGGSASGAGATHMQSVSPIGQDPEKSAYNTGVMTQREHKTTGWAPTCDHDGETMPGTVLDPFMGSGTTAKVAHDEGRHYLGAELNPEYVEIARKRIASAPLQMQLVT